MTSINTQVVTIVLLSTRNSYWKKIRSSGLKRNVWPPFPPESFFRLRACEPPHDDEPRDQESNKACHEPRPVTL